MGTSYVLVYEPYSLVTRHQCWDNQSALLLCVLSVSIPSPAHAGEGIKSVFTLKNRDTFTTEKTSTKIKPHDSVRCHGVSVEIQVCAIVSLRQGVKVLSHICIMCENK